ncbi:hypothetical protein ACF3M2_13255 [Tissierella carlieri]|uniref:hypothetical protein n=1 Tax=Tissierella carlieri TaxID=689904 RepID=UPI002803DD20|nr:hypothetical protein [uncultured Tissierella sp.]MDU5081472.1 hypothetical protein [Bacillota bacterium]
MKTKKIKSSLQGFLLVLVAAITLTACGMTESSKGTIMSLTGNENGSVLFTSTINTRHSTSGIENGRAGFTGEYLVESVSGDEKDSQLEYWEINEFEEWMEHQRTENKKLADSGDKSFYYKNANSDYICREWTQEDVDTLYAQWQKQIALMKQGYHYTKPITLSDGGVLVGVFDPETWNAKSESVPGSTIITLPDGSAVDLGHFDTSSEAAEAVKRYLSQQAKDGVLTQHEADTILTHGSVE